jgi:hypothetical protein
MTVFKNRAKTIFPFAITGCKALVAGAKCNLQVSPVPVSWLRTSSPVTVSTTNTSVKLTVLGANYFNAPGSTITFRTFEQGGFLYFQQHGVAISPTWEFEVGHGAGIIDSAWHIQATRLTVALGGPCSCGHGGYPERQ